MVVVYNIGKRRISHHLPSIGVILLELRGVQDGHIHEFGFILQSELFQDNGHLPRVGARIVGVENNRLRHGGSSNG